MKKVIVIIKDLTDIILEIIKSLKVIVIELINSIFEILKELYKIAPLFEKLTIKIISVLGWIFLLIYIVLSNH